MITILLTKEQRAAIRPVMDQVNEAYKLGLPGMAIAQVFPDSLEIGFIDNEKGKKLQGALTGSSAAATIKYPI